MLILWETSLFFFFFSFVYCFKVVCAECAYHCCFIILFFLLERQEGPCNLFSSLLGKKRIEAAYLKSDLILLPTSHFQCCSFLSRNVASLVSLFFILLFSDNSMIVQFSLSCLDLSQQKKMHQRWNILLSHGVSLFLYSHCFPLISFVSTNKTVRFINPLSEGICTVT